MKIIILFTLTGLLSLNTVLAKEKIESNPNFPFHIDSTEHSEPAVTLGEISSIYSKVLDKTIPLSIHLPANYGSSSKIYPVLYMLGSDYRARFAMLASTLDYMGEGQIPEMILIGVGLPEGNSILLPTRGNQDTAIPDNYIKFFETELMPHVENKYRAAPFNVLFGASNSGFFSVYTLLNNPLLFNSYLASSPSLRHIPEVIQERIKYGPLKTLTENRSLYIVYSDDDSDATTESISEFSLVLEEHKPENFTYKVEELVNQGHVPATDFTQFLLALYPDFNPYENLDSLDNVIQHFDMLSKRYGYEVLPPVSVIFNLGVDMIINKNLVVAEEIFQYSLQVYPEGKESYLGMGVVHRNQGQFESARVMFEKALIIDPDYSLANRLLQGLDRSKLTLLSRPIPTDTPLVFAPDLISINDHASASITFSPDMTELFFNHRKAGESYNLYTMKLTNGRWSEPEPAFFSIKKEYLDFHPRFSPKGDRLYFGSTRPVNDTIKKLNTRRRLHQWYVEKNENGGDWSEPILMGQPFVDAYMMGAVPSENGNLYFTSGKGAGADDEGIYYAINQNGRYASIESMGDVINTNGKWIAHPYIAPDESYLIYDSEKATEPDNGDLFISFNQNGTWSESYSLGDQINTEMSEGAATVSPDGKYLFFRRSEEKVREDGSTYWISKIYWVDFTKLKKEVLENINNN
ncbi:MAG: alpha/beta hydrolase-fold protein [Bacteroidota bacterium]